MKKRIGVLLLMFAQLFCFSQNDDVKKIVKQFNDGEYAEAISKMTVIAEKSGQDEDWDLVMQMHESRLRRSSDVTFQLSLNIMGAKEMSASDALKELVQAALEATRRSQSPIASQDARVYLVDYRPDTLVPKEARGYFSAAEDSFTRKKYSDAILLYRNALKVFPDYYKANIYLGDSYWYLNQMDSAEYYFQKGISRCPNLLEPKKYLVDALSYEKKNTDAKAVCIEAICIYPDVSMLAKYDVLLHREGKKLNTHWMARNFELNTWGKQDGIKDKEWKVYRKAKEEVAGFCDKGGMLSANKVTSQKYLEVYCWEKLLSSDQKLPPEFDFARKMMKEGYLDCYVFVSMFHQDEYAQFADFMKSNKQRVGEYISKYLTE